MLLLLGRRLKSNPAGDETLQPAAVPTAIDARDKTIDPLDRSVVG